MEWTRGVTYGGPGLSKVIKPDDFALVRRVRAGDREAFSRLVLRHQDPVYRVCYRVLGGREDAEDAAQEAFVRAFRKLDGFEGRSSFRTWVIRLAMNVSLNELERRKSPLLDAPTPAPAPDPQDELLRSETIARVHEALMDVRPNHRAAVVLKDLEGLSFKEISEALEVPEGTARVWAHRGRARLKELLA